MTWLSFIILSCLLKTVLIMLIELPQNTMITILPRFVLSTVMDDHSILSDIIESKIMHTSETGKSENPVRKIILKAIDCYYPVFKEYCHHILIR